jgi:hypothetical protein
MASARLGDNRQELLAAHHADPACTQADPASLNRQHWHAHGSDLTSFLDAHPVQG